MQFPRPNRLAVASVDTRMQDSWERMFPADAGFECRMVSVESLSAAADADLLIVSLEERAPLDVLASLPAVPVIVVLSADTPAEIVRVAAMATEDFAFHPIRPEELRERVERVLGRRPDAAISDALREEFTMLQLVGCEPAFLRAVSTIPRISRAELPVLITGETGTGKELCARAIHHLSPRRHFPFIAVDCGAVPEQLFESEIFGHTRGAFTGACAERKGLIQMAEGGTLFLDEVDSLNASAQSKLLRFLECKAFRALGSDRVSQANLRILCGTNKNLTQKVASGEFRSDLLFRIDVLRIELPPLRKRMADVALLAEHLLLLHAPKDGARRIGPAAIRKLMRYDWPGNVRELQNVLLRASLAADNGFILPQHIDLPVSETGDSAELDHEPETFREARSRALQLFEREYVNRLIERNQGNVTRAAREAGKERRAFGRLVKKYGLGA